MQQMFQASEDKILNDHSILQENQNTIEEIKNQQENFVKVN